MYRQVVAVMLALAVSLPVAAQESYVGDPGHTMASFETGHLGVSWIRGRFNKTTSARVVLDRAAGKGAIDVTIDTASIDTGHEGRDKHLRSADYLDVEKFPAMTFRSNNLKFSDDVLTGADGELTLMGATRPVSLKVSMFRCIQHPVNKKALCGAEAATAIKRSEFGLKRGAVGIGDDVRISIQIEAYKE